MTRTIPIPALIQEGWKGLDAFPKDYTWTEHERIWNFSL